MEIEIRNWDKYNPKRDQKTYTWLRLDNDIARGPEFYGLKNLERYIAILILCEASKGGKGRFWLDMEWFCDEVAKEPIEFVLSTIDKLSAKNRKGESFIIIHTPFEDPNQTSLLEVSSEESARDNALHDTTPNDTELHQATPGRQDTTPTNERTDVTNGRTDGQNTKPTFQIEPGKDPKLSCDEISFAMSGILKKLEHNPLDSPSEPGSQAVGA